MKTKTYIRKFIQAPLLVIGLLLATSCETLDTDLTQDPSQLNPENSQFDLLFNAMQLQFGTFFYQSYFPAAQVSRMELMRNSQFYTTQFQPINFDGIWTTAYSGFLSNARLMSQKLAEFDAENEDFHADNYRAAGLIMEAYIITTLVDYFGDIPYSEALQGGGNLNPGRDNQRAVYENALDLLDEAIAIIDAGGSIAIESDIYYSSDMEKWKRLAGSLILKLSVNSRLNDSDAAARINSVVSSANYISSNAGDFQFSFTTTQANPDSRHPLFSLQYDATATLYMCKDYLERLMKKDVTDPSDPHTPGDPYDPRFNYYFYLQDGTLDFARVHGDNQALINSEYNVMPVHGLYPVGGKYNDGSTGPSNREDGAMGEGAHIIMTHSFTQFLIAEAELMVNGNAGAARTALQNGIQASMDKVTNFKTHAIPSGASTPTAADISDYISDAMDNYDNAAGDQAKLNVIITEYYKALWGNGMEAYNNFRRTGYPADMPATTVSNPGTFTHTMFYPNVHIANNSSAQQRGSLSEKVWWAEGTSFNLDY